MEEKIKELIEIYKKINQETSQDNTDHVEYAFNKGSIKTLELVIENLKKLLNESDSEKIQKTLKK